MNKTETVKVVTSLHPQLCNNNTFNGTGVEVAGFAEALVVVAIGVTDVALTTLKLQESDDNSNWTDVTDGAITGADLPASGDDNKSWAFHYSVLGKGKRYVRPVLVAGSATGAYIHSYAVLGGGSIAGSDTSRGFELTVSC